MTDEDGKWITVQENAPYCVGCVVQPSLHTPASSVQPWMLVSGSIVVGLIIGAIIVGVTK